MPFRPPHAPCVALRRRRAFSSIELLGAMVISLVLAFIGLAGFQLYQKGLPLESAAGQLTHAATTARSLAIARNGTYALVISQRYQNYWIDETDAAGTTIVSKVTTPERVDVKVQLADVFPGVIPDPAGLDLNKIRFFADGSSDNAFIYLLPDNKKTNPQASDYTTVRIYGPTGQSRVIEHQHPGP